MRSVKRIIRFLEQKTSKKLAIRNKLTLSVKVLPQTNCDPLPPKTLSVSRRQQISVQSLPRYLTYRKFPTTEIVPGIQNDGADLFSTYINGGSHCTIFVCWFHTHTCSKWNRLENKIEVQALFWARVWRVKLVIEPRSQYPQDFLLHHIQASFPFSIVTYCNIHH